MILATGYSMKETGGQDHGKRLPGLSCKTVQYPGAVEQIRTVLDADE